MAKKSAFDAVFKDVDSMNVDACTLEDSALSLVDSWTDTGSYALNAICSGSLFGGVPQGRIVGLTGPSGCGKTLMMTKILGNFQKKDPENWGVVFDSEVAVDKDTAIRLGANPNQIRHYPVESVTQTRNQILKLLDGIIENNMQGKVMILIDSLGNLAGDKEIKDAQEDKQASDMGTRAKSIKSMLRTCTYRTAKAGTTLLFSNHIYNNPSQMYPTLVKTQSGGESPIYLASLLIQLGFKLEKNEKDFEGEKILGAAKNVGGITMHAMTSKNRFIPPFLSTDLYLNFMTGLDKYSGLFDMAKSMGIITGEKTYEIGGKKLGFRKDFEHDPEVWEKIIIPVMEPIIKKQFTFSSDVEALQEELDALQK